MFSWEFRLAWGENCSKSTQHKTIQYNALYNMLSWEFKLGWGENCSENILYSAFYCIVLC